MFIEFSEDCQKVIMLAKREMYSLKHSYLGSEHFILALLKEQKREISSRLFKYGITYEAFRSKLIDLIGYGERENTWFIFTPLFKRVIEDTMLEAKDRNYKYITVEGLFLSLLEEAEGIGIRVLMTLGLSIDRFYNEYNSYIRTSNRKKNKNNFLEEFGVDLVLSAKKNKLDPAVGRDDEIEQIIEVLLRRKKNNPLLIGPAGVGKTAVVEELARRIAEGNVPNKLKDKKIFSISMASLVSGTKYRGEFEERINKLIKEIESNCEYILFVDEIHTLVGAGGAEGAIDASNIFKPALSRGNFSLIGATTEVEYDKYISNDKALQRRFQSISIEEPKEEKVIYILKNIKSLYEEYYNIKIPTNLLNEIVVLSNRYIFANKQPDKAIELLDSSCCHAFLNKSNKEKKINLLNEEIKKCISLKRTSILSNNFIDAKMYLEKEKQLKNKKELLSLKNDNSKKQLSIKDIVAVLEKKTGIYLFQFHNKKLSLLPILCKRIVGQDNVLREIVEETENYLFGDNNGPLSFLFVGPSGVGKTYTASIYHDILYSSKPFLRLDMSEYKEQHTISKIIGSPAGYIGYGDSNTILNQIQKHPHTVLLLDEIEKAHPSVLNLFLQILDNGVIKNSMGEEISFKHTTIIMTSNLGFSKNSVGFYRDNSKSIVNSLKEYLNVEFINRIKKICIFNYLDIINAQKILKRVWNSECVKCGKKRKLTKKISDRIIKEAQIDVFGARQIVNLVKKEVKNTFKERV